MAAIDKILSDQLDASARILDRLFVDRARPRQIRTIRQWFETEIIIPSGPRRGEPWSADTQPVQALLLDLMDSGQFTEFVTNGPTQTGKSIVGYVGPTLYHASELRETVVLGIPGGGMVQDKWADITEILDAAPNLRRLIPTTGPGSLGGQIKDSVRLGNNTRLRFMTTGGKNTGRAGYTSRVVCVTEMADFSVAGKQNSESDPYRQIQGRSRAFDPSMRRTYAEGTVTLEHHYPWSARVGACVALIVMRCPHCKEFVQLDRENLRGFEDATDGDEAASNTYLECPKCSGKITEPQRRTMVKAARIIFEGQEIDRAGNVTGDRPRSNRLWFRYNAAHNLLVSIGEVGREEWQALQHPPESKQRREADRQISQQLWARPVASESITTEIKEIDFDKIAGRRFVTPANVLPQGTLHLACGIDVGVRRLHLTTLAVTASNQILVVEKSTHETGYVDESSGVDGSIAVRVALGDLVTRLRRGYIEQGTGRMVLPSRILIDNSWETDTIRQWLAAMIDTEPNLKRQIILARGKGINVTGGKFRLPMSPGRYEIERADDQTYYVHLIGEGTMVPEACLNADVWKVRVQSAAQALVDSPGALLLHEGQQRDHITYIRHLFAEREKTEFDPRKGEVTRMVPVGKANHYLDSTSYGFVGLCLAGWDFASVQTQAVEFARAAASLTEKDSGQSIDEDEADYIASRQAAPTIVAQSNDEEDEDYYTDGEWGATPIAKNNDPHAHLF